MKGISSVELRQLEYQKQTDEKFDEVFNYISDHAESEQKIFYDGQIYDAFSLITSIISKAKKEIVLIDGYVDVNTLNLLAKKKNKVLVHIHTYPQTKLSQKDIDKFNDQYPTLTVSHSKKFHDRFLILDGKDVYHIGASIKDAGLKCFAISKMQDAEIAKDLLERI